MKIILNFIRRTFILAGVLSLALLFSCSDSSSDSSEQLNPPTQENPAVKVLKKLGDRVTIDSVGTDQEGKSVVYFYFTQPLDHNDESKGTFKQYCAFHYKGKDKITVINTNGYSIADKDKFSIQDIEAVFGTNYLEVEHRYFKHSKLDLPVEDHTKADYWKYNKAIYSTADLHALVTALKDTGDFQGKWISTGTSKDGILTSFYAFQYPNDVDVYLPFCAPFFTEQDSLSVGQYIANVSGANDKKTENDDKTVNDYVWDCLKQYLSNPTAMSLVEDYARKEEKKAFENQNSQYVKLNMVQGFFDAAFVLFSYVNVNSWSDIIPLYENLKTQLEVYAQCFYLFARTDTNNMGKNIKKIREIMFPGTPERCISNKILSLPYVLPDDQLDEIYCVQAAMELGYFLYDYSQLSELLTKDDIKYLNSATTIKIYNTNYGVTYDNGAFTRGFFDFLGNNAEKTKCKMIFVYGDNDPWTGAAIPDNYVDNTYIKKLLIRKGVHSPQLNDENSYSKEDRQKVIDAINEFLK